MQGILPRGLRCAAIVTLALQTTAAEPQTRCVNLGPQRADLARVAREAVALLAACGYDPADYDLELSQDDRFAAEAPSWTIEFHPRRLDAHYPLGIRMEQPCALRWLDGGEAHPRQREVMQLVRRIAAEHGVEEFTQLTVTESTAWIGVELELEARDDSTPTWTILLDRQELSLLEIVEP